MGCATQVLPRYALSLARKATETWRAPTSHLWLILNASARHLVRMLEHNLCITEKRPATTKVPAFAAMLLKMWRYSPLRDCSCALPTSRCVNVRLIRAHANGQTCIPGFSDSPPVPQRAVQCLSYCRRKLPFRFLVSPSCMSPWFFSLPFSVPSSLSRLPLRAF